METTGSLLVFCSWLRSIAHRSWFTRVLAALKPLEQQGMISLCHDDLLSPGCDVDQGLARASVVLLLLTPDYLASKQDYRERLQVRQRHGAGEIWLTPVLLRGGHRDPLGSEHPTPVATTWDLSCSRVRERHPEAAALLHFCAFLAPDSIPEALLDHSLQGSAVTIL